MACKYVNNQNKSAFVRKTRWCKTTVFFGKRDPDSLRSPLSVHYVRRNPWDIYSQALFPSRLVPEPFFPRQHTNSYDVARTLPLSMKNYKYVLPAHLWRALWGEDEDVFTKTSGQCGCFFFIFTWLKTAWFTFWMLFAPRAAFSGRICSL